jgi:hypothetical protein
MSVSPPGPYKIEKGAGVKEQIKQIRLESRKAGKYLAFIEIMEKAIARLQDNPNEWGDPEFHTKTIDAVMRHGIIRPISFRFAVYEQAHAVVLLRVRQYDDFD